MKKKVLTCLILVVAVALIVGILLIERQNSNTEDKSSKIIKVNEVTRSVFYAPQYVAINQGFFKDNGLEIELTTGERC